MKADYFEKYKKYEKYLPSKKFAFLILGVGGALVIILVISSYFGSRTSFNEGAKPKVSSEGTVSDIVSRDSNNNGIPDWEETLWGLDPTADGATNKKIIEQKQEANDITPSDTTGAQDKTDQFSQQLLSTILAMQQSGTLTPQTLEKVAESVGDSVDAVHTNANTYSLSDMKLYPTDSPAAKAAYESALRGVVSQYDDVDLGSEMTIMAESLDSDDAGALAQLAPFASAYTQLGKQIIALKTPPAVAQNALDLANASEQMGASLVQVENLYTDAISGMVGVDDYTKASDLSDRATDTLSAYFGN